MVDLQDGCAIFYFFFKQISEMSLPELLSVKKKSLPKTGFKASQSEAFPCCAQLACAAGGGANLFRCSCSWPRRCSTSPYVISLAELSSSLSSWNCADSSMKSAGFLQAHLSQHRSAGEGRKNGRIYNHMWVTTTSLQEEEGKKKSPSKIESN